MWTDLAKYERESQITFSVTHGWSVFWRTDHARRDDRTFLEALHYFVVHNITWRALPEKFGHWNSVWKRFWRLSQSGTFEAFFDALAALSETAHLVQMFDSTVVRAHVSAAGAKGGSTIRRLAARVVASLPRFT